MTGVREMRHVETVTAVPSRVAVSVLGGRTQLDVNLPADVPIAALLPELAELITSRDDPTGARSDERRTYWQLRTLSGSDPIPADQTLRNAGVVGGEVLVISQRTSLSPPTLYDDVVDAAARLNRASFAAWDAGAAKWMALVGVWGTAGVFAYFVMGDRLSGHRWTVASFAIGFAVALAAAAMFARRGFGLADVGAALAWPAVVLLAVVGVTMAAPHGAEGLVIAGVALLLVLGLICRAVGIGPWLPTGGAVVIVGGVAVAGGHALGAGIDELAAASAVAATAMCLAVPVVTRGMARHATPAAVEEAGPADLFSTNGAAGTRHIAGAEAMPTAEDVWARGRRATMVRSALTAGAAVVAAGSSFVMLARQPDWPACTFALVVASLLAIRIRRVHTAAERSALAVPAVALVLVGCLSVQEAPWPLAVAALAVLATLAVAAATAGVLRVRPRPRWLVAADYLDYALVVGLIPVALWALGFYGRVDW